MKAAPAIEIKVADEVWIIVALMHRARPGIKDFSIEEIMERAERVSVAGRLRAGVYAHVVQHCVANRTPNSGRYRMLIETGPGRRRLYRPGDSYDPRREGAKTKPNKEDMPIKYQSLLEWYDEWNRTSPEDRVKADPLLALYGSGKDLWADEGADEYVRRLREGWE